MESIIPTLVKEYLELFPDENKRVEPLLSHLEDKNAQDIFSRSSVPGHITASMFVFHKEAHSVLLIHHAFLDMHIQPGGHIEPEDTDMLSAAIRELLEETGIDQKDISIISMKTNTSNVPFNIDIHSIPENQQKNEPPHLHYDFQYLAYINSLSNIKKDAVETKGISWVTLNRFEHMSNSKFNHMSNSKRIAKKIRAFVKFDS